MKTAAIALIVAAAAIVPFAAADDELSIACFLAENGHHSVPVIDESHTGAAAAACWTVRGFTGPVGTETVPDPNAGIHPEQTCGSQPVLSYEACVDLALLGASASVYPTQRTISCGSSCTYVPTSHVALSNVLTGAWRIDGSSHLRAVSGGGVGNIVSGSQRTISCTATGEGASCHQQVDHAQISAGNFNTFLWQGSWSVTFTDATGASHLMATGSDQCYIAQYYNPPNDACEGNG